MADTFLAFVVVIPISLLCYREFYRLQIELDQELFVPKRRAWSGSPGFSVALSIDDPPNKNNSAGDVVVFDQIFTNEDSAYNANTGKVTIQKLGMYFIQFSITSIRKDGADGNALFTLFHKSGTSGSDLVKGENDPREDQQEVSFTKGILLDLKEQDQLWVKFQWIGQGHRPLLKGNSQTFFLGYRVG